jgi:ABC-type multidrug transport system fused ATPase/permease subunit
MIYAVRCQLFEALIHRQPSWFDSRKERSALHLSSMLRDEVGKLTGLTTEHTATKAESLMGIILGVLIAVTKNWAITLVIIALTPLVLIGGAFSSVFDQIQQSKRENPQDPYHSSNILLKDLILNYRTLKSFSRPNIDPVLQRFTELLEPPTQTNIKHAHAFGAAYGYSLCIRFVYIGLVFLIGARLAKSDPDLTFKDIF